MSDIALLEKYLGHKPKILAMLNRSPNGRLSLTQLGDEIPLTVTNLRALSEQLEQEGLVKTQRVGLKLMVSLTEGKTPSLPAENKAAENNRAVEKALDNMIKKKKPAPIRQQALKTAGVKKPVAPRFERKGEGRLAPYTPRHLNAASICKHGDSKKVIIRAEGKRSITLFIEDLYPLAEKLVRHKKRNLDKQQKE